MIEPDRFTLTISLGNDAMQTATDVAEALRLVATKLEVSHGGDRLSYDGGNIYDLNGNSVGEWGVE